MPSWIRIRIPDPLTRLNLDRIRIRNPGYINIPCSGPGCGGRPTEQVGQHGGTEQRIHSVPPRTRQEKVSRQISVSESLLAAVWRIRDVYPGSDFLPSRIRTVSIPDPGSSYIKELKYFNPQKSKKMVSKLKKI